MRSVPRRRRPPRAPRSPRRAATWSCAACRSTTSCRPDVVFRAQRVAVFVHGCFWHGCAAHYRPPSSNAAYWSAKVARNRARDSRQRARLLGVGWRVVEVWEHEVVHATSMEAVVERVARAAGAWTR